MSAKTVTYGGRTWCHQQLHALLKRLAEDGYRVTIRQGRQGAYVVQLRRGMYERVDCHSTTIWRAMVRAVTRFQEAYNHEPEEA